MDENVTAIIMFLIFVSSVLVLVLLVKGMIDEADDRDLIVEQVLRELDERRGKQK